MAPISHSAGPQNGRPKKSRIQRAAPADGELAGEFHSARSEEAQPENDEAAQDEQREDGEAAVIQELAGDQPLQHLAGAERIRFPRLVLRECG